MTEFATLSLMAGRGKVLTVRSCTSLRSSFDGRSVKTYFTAFSKLVALFLLFFYSFFAPMFVTYAPTLVTIAPTFVTFAPTFVAFAVMFVTFASMFVTFAPTIVAFGPMFVAFGSTTKFA